MTRYLSLTSFQLLTENFATAPPAYAVLPAHDFAEPPHSPVIFAGAPWDEARSLERAAVHGGFLK